MARSAPATEPLRVIEDVGTGNRFVVYTTKSGTHLELHFDGEEPWFSQKDLAAMYGVNIRTANDHIQKYLDDGELDEAVVRDFRITARARTAQHPRIAHSVIICLKEPVPHDI